MYYYKRKKYICKICEKKIRYKIHYEEKECLFNDKYEYHPYIKAHINRLISKYPFLIKL